MKRDNVEDIRKINEAIALLDRMSKSFIELSYKFKKKAISNDGTISAELLKDILILREIQEKEFDSMHELLSSSMTAVDLYSMIS